MSFGANVNLGGEIYPKQIGYVWDPIGMSYVVAQQAVGGTGGAGDASAANQLLGNASLVSIDTKTPALVSGRQPVDGSGVVQPVSLTDGANVTQGAKADAAWDLIVATPSGVAIWKKIAGLLDSIRVSLAGTLVVTGPLTDAQLRASAIQVDVADEDTRLLGRAKLLDSGGVVIDPATKGQLPAALAAGGGLKVEGVAGGVAQPISGTVTANAGTGPFPVSDNAGSLTVDAPVGTPAFVRLSDGAAPITTLPVSMATQTPDVTDRAVRLLGVVASITAPVATTSAAASQADGHSASIGATSDASSANTMIGRLKALIALLPAALVGGRLDANTGAWLGSTAPTVGQKTMANAVPVVIASDQTAVKTVGDPEVTYHVLYRLAARPYALSKAAIAANTRTQVATLYHVAAATKRMRLRRVLVLFESETVGGMVTFDLVKLTAAVTPATGNPAITPTPATSAAAAAEATALALPTTGGTEGALIADMEFNIGITGAVGTTNPPQPDLWYELFSEDEQNPMGEQQALEVAAGVAGGWAVVLDNVGATNTAKCKVKMVFTEK